MRRSSFPLSGSAEPFNFWYASTMASSMAWAMLSDKAVVSRTYLPFTDRTAPEYRLILSSSSSTGFHFYRQQARWRRRKRRHRRRGGHQNSGHRFPGVHVGLIHLRDLVQVLQQVIAEYQRVRCTVHEFDLWRVDYDLGGASGCDLDGARIHRDA